MKELYITVLNVTIQEKGRKIFVGILHQFTKEEHLPSIIVISVTSLEIQNSNCQNMLCQNMSMLYILAVNVHTKPKLKLNYKVMLKNIINMIYFYEIKK